MALVAAIGALGGCSSAGVATSSDGPTLAARTVDDPTSEAIVGGELSFDGRCVRLSGRAVVWPVGTELRGQTLAVVLRDDTSILAGDRVFGAGGMYPARWARDLTSARGAEAISRCTTGAEGIIVFNARHARLRLQR
jgi:hypothetical protein